MLDPNITKGSQLDTYARLTPDYMKRINAPGERPILTMLTKHKWYELVLWNVEDDTFKLLHFGHLACWPGAGAPYRDHCPNPMAAIYFAVTNDYMIDWLAMEAIAGRWAIEVLDTYEIAMSYAEPDEPEMEN